jgi:hypothetical protein
MVDWAELQKTRVADLRNMVKEQMPDVTGVVGLKKEELVELLAKKLGIEKPHKHVVGVDKTTMRGRIKELKVKRAAALAAHDSGELKKQRRAIHRLKRKLRKAEVIS